MRLFTRKLRSSGSANGADARVQVKGGYHPETIVTQAGRPLRITFRREEASPCSERVVFPDFDITAVLPQDEDVTVKLLPERVGEYGFACGMGMLRGRLVVTPAMPETAEETQLERS